MTEKEVIALLKKNNFSCVLYNQNKMISKTQRGIRPLMEILDSGEDFSGFCVVDKVVGKAAAFLYVLLGIKKVYAMVISKPASDVLNQYGIDLEYEVLTEKIQNRTKTGLCPMETAVFYIDNPNQALSILREKLIELS